MKASGVGVVAVVVSLALAGCVSGPAVTGSPAVTASPSDGAHRAAVQPDFDGDGIADLVIGTGEREGRLVVRYGSGQERSLVRAELDGGSSLGFGQGLLARDLNRDGHTDLVIGDPDTAADNGPAIFVLFGGVGGLDVAGFHRYPAPMDSAGFGAELALVEDPDPVLAVGAGDGNPESGGGILIYPLGEDGLPAAEPERLSQGTAGVPDTGEPGDAFGTVLASTGALLVVGVPREDVGTVVDAGAVAVLTHHGRGRFTGEWITQDSPGVPDRAESDDRFGSVLAAGDGYVVVGVPLEDLDEVNAGLVQPFRITPDGLEPLADLDRQSVGEDATAGWGFFGRSLTIARPCARVPGIAIGARDQADGADPGASGVWLASLDPDECAVSRVLAGKVLGGLGGIAHVGSQLSALRTDEAQPDTLVLAARGEPEEGVLGGVVTLGPPYDGPAVTILEGIRVHEEREFALSPPAG